MENKTTEMYHSNDMIYHYTSTEKALGKILPTKKLRFSLRKESADPIENLNPLFSFSANGEQNSILNEYANEIKDDIKEYIGKTKQLCFCKNNKDARSGISSPDNENLAFMKPRMWDQYGDKYKGVCLAFSLEELKKKATRNVFHDDIDYIKYNDMSIRHQSINLREISEIGKEEYFKKYFEYFKKRLFDKHFDYINENEYRFCSFDTEEIDISNALKGIIIMGNGLNRYLLESFKSISESFYNNVDIRLLSLKNSYSISHIDSILNIEESMKIELGKLKQSK